jgi:hypothetical protein
MGKDYTLILGSNDLRQPQLQPYDVEVTVRFSSDYVGLQLDDENGIFKALPGLFDGSEVNFNADFQTANADLDDRYFKNALSRLDFVSEYEAVPLVNDNLEEGYTLNGDDVITIQFSSRVGFVTVSSKDTDPERRAIVSVVLKGA